MFFRSELKVQLEELRQEMNDSKPIAKSLPEGDSLDVYMMEMASKKEELEVDSTLFCVFDNCVFVDSRSEERNKKDGNSFGGNRSIVKDH